jgi:hypothetical protein
MEQQHQVPQQISSYQFRLVGDMTLKQFFQVAGGAIVALIIYSSSLPGYVRWPLIIVSVLMGAALAFFPIQDRPLEKWIFSFFKSIYSPTMFVWKKDASPKDYFLPEKSNLPQISIQGVAPTSPQTTTPTATNTEHQHVVSPQLEEKEKEFLSKVTQHFSNSDAPATLPRQQLNSNLSPVGVPQSGAVKMGTGSATSVPEAKPSEGPSSVQITETKLRPATTASSPTNASQAVFSNAAAPSMPTTPNVVVGQVQDSQRKIIENAILEIKDNQGRPVRALKSNKLGHFMIVTPLLNGKYEMVIEKPGYVFKPVSFTVDGNIVPPIIITAEREKGTQEDEAGTNNAVFSQV